MHDDDNDVYKYWDTEPRYQIILMSGFPLEHDSDKTE